MFIKTKYLIPTHNRLRTPSLVEVFLSDIKSLSEALDSEKDKIDIAEVEGCLYILNSHHRMVAMDILCGGIDDSRLNIKEYSLDDMLSFNPEKGWFTPFDPYYYCRVPDFLALKKSIVQVYDRVKKNGETHWKPYVNWISTKIVEPRTVHSLGELYDI